MKLNRSLQSAEMLMWAQTEACAEERERDFTSQEGGEALGEACSPQDRRDRGRTAHWKEREEPRGGCRAAKESQHHQHHSLSLQEHCSTGHRDTEGKLTDSLLTGES